LHISKVRQPPLSDPGGLTRERCTFTEAVAPIKKSADGRAASTSVDTLKIGDALAGHERCYPSNDRPLKLF